MYIRVPWYKIKDRSRHPIVYRSAISAGIEIVVIFLWEVRARYTQGEGEIERTRKTPMMMRTTRGNNKRWRIEFTIHGRQCRGKNGGVLGRPSHSTIRFLSAPLHQNRRSSNPFVAIGIKAPYWTTMTSRRQKKREAFRYVKRTSFHRWSYYGIVSYFHDVKANTHTTAWIVWCKFNKLW